MVFIQNIQTGRPQQLAFIHFIVLLKGRSRQDLQYFTIQSHQFKHIVTLENIELSCCKVGTSLRQRNPSSQKFQSLQHFVGSSEIPTICQNIDTDISKEQPGI